MIPLPLSDWALQWQGGEVHAREALVHRLGLTAQLEPRVRAWTVVDGAAALKSAQALDHSASRANVPLCGVPVGVKDIIDTAGLPTRWGTPLAADRRPEVDAPVVARLRAMGAVVMGKTVTTELATYQPGPTTHPHWAGHTPGGSSSGSAAAVACGMVPVALGSQTNGSIIRPASFCGVVGFKPHRSAHSLAGVLSTSPSFDTLGWFTRTVEDMAWWWRRFDGLPSLPAVGAADRAARCVWLDIGLDSMVHAHARHTFERWRVARGFERVRPWPAEVTLRLLEVHRLVMEHEMAAAVDALFGPRVSELSFSLQAQLARGRECSSQQHREALEELAALQRELDQVWDHADVLVMPSSLGVAPAGHASTGSPVMATLGTATDWWALSTPLRSADHPLPLGVQWLARQDRAPLFWASVLTWGREAPPLPSL